MAKRTLTMTVRVDGLRETLARFRALPKDASAELREKSKELSEYMAGVTRQAARQDEAPQTRLLIPTIKAVKDRVPAVQVGGTRKVGRHRVPAYAVVFGSEFGMNRRSGWYARPRYRRSGGRQYRPHGGQQGYWFFPTVEAEQDRIARAWQAVADEVLSNWED